ncbi:hypothetical protein [Brevundimonas vesicularis]|uniref:hypothetical protein n=1 Tax=Brevundimonas vesicularis TaxID=41276 RepID=UPI0038D4E943
MITFATLNREQLLAALGGKFSPSERSLGYGPFEPKPGYVVALWPDDEDQDIPSVIIVPANELKEFYAFAVTYIGSYSPFSAFFRVVADELAEMFIPVGPRPDTNIVRAGLSMAVAEACIHFDSKRWEEVPLQACLATQSAVGAAVVSAGYDPILTVSAMRRWHHVRSLMQLDQLRVDPDRIERIWTHLLAWSGNDFTGGAQAPIEDDVLALIEAFRSPMRDTADVLFAIADGKVPLQLMQFGDLPREDRVRRFEDAVGRVLNSTLNNWRKEIMIGALAAQVADGSFRYLQLAMQHRDQAPHSAIWFSIFASLNRNTDLLAVAGNLVARLERKLPRKGNIFSQLSADMSYEECLMLSPEGRLPRVRTEQQSVLQVELFPAINGRFRLDRDVRREGSSEGTASLSQISTIRRLAGQLMSVVSEMDDARNRNERQPAERRPPPPLEDLFSKPAAVRETTATKSAKKGKGKT